MRAAVVLTILLIAMTTGCLGGATPELEVIVSTATPEPSATPSVQATVDAGTATALTKATEAATTPPLTKHWPRPAPTFTPEPTPTSWRTPAPTLTEWKNSGAWYRAPSLDDAIESFMSEEGYKVQAKTVVADYERHEDLDPMRIQLTCVETDYGYKAFGAVIGLLTDSFPAEASELFLSVYDHQISEYLDGFGHTIKPLLRDESQYAVVILSPRDLIPLRKSLEKASEDANRYSVIVRLYDAEDNELKFSSFATNGFDETMQYLDCD